ncbi:MAG: hypothetical protein WCI67_02500 [Chloroflexales bacterium]
MHYRTRGSLWISALILFILFSTIPAQPVAAATSALQIVMSTTTPVVNSGDPVVFLLNYRCATTTDAPCVNAVVTDVLPPEFSGAAIDVLMIGTIDTIGQSYIPATRTAKCIADKLRFPPICQGPKQAFSLAFRTNSRSPIRPSVRGGMQTGCSGYINFARYRVKPG